MDGWMDGRMRTPKQVGLVMKNCELQYVDAHHPKMNFERLAITKRWFSGRKKNKITHKKKRMRFSKKRMRFSKKRMRFSLCVLFICFCFF